MTSEKKGLTTQLEISTRKLATLRKAYAIASDDSKKFDLKSQIAELEEEITELKLRINSFFNFSTSETFNIDKPMQRYGEISCDRVNEIDALKQSFENNKDKKFQHYFIKGHFEDNPHSLVERFIHEELSVTYSNVDYESVVINTERILKVNEFPIDFNIEKSKHKMQGYFEKRFNHIYTPGSSKIESLSNFLDSDHPFLQKDYIITVFKISKGQKKDILPEFLKWVMNEFCSGSHPKLKFIFFYILLAEEKKDYSILSLLPVFLRSSKYDFFVQMIRDLQKDCACHFCIQGLSRVEISDIKDWFSRYSNKTYEIEALIESAKIHYKNDYDQKNNAFRMHAIESFLSEVISRKSGPAF